MKILVLWGMATFMLLLPLRIASSDVQAPSLGVILLQDRSVWLQIAGAKPGATLTIESSPSIVPLDEWNDEPPWQTWHTFQASQLGSYTVCIGSAKAPGAIGRFYRLAGGE